EVFRLNAAVHDWLDDHVLLDYLSHDEQSAMDVKMMKMMIMMMMMMKMMMMVVLSCCSHCTNVFVQLVMHAQHTIAAQLSLSLHVQAIFDIQNAVEVHFVNLLILFCV